METLSIAEKETGDPSLLISSLHLLVPPLQLLSAAMWKILQQQAVLHYGKLEQYVSLVMEAFPELLSESQRTELILGLQQFGSKTDPALEVLLWEFLSRLDQLLPVPDLKQTVSWLSAAPSVLEDCVQSVSYPDQLKTLLRHRRSLGQLGMNGTILSIECNLPSMSHPPSHSMDYSTKLKNTNSQSESLTECINFFSPAPSGEDVQAESVIDRTDYEGVEPRSGLNRCSEIEENGYWISTEKDVLTNRKEGQEEQQGVKMEREDVRHEEEHKEEEEKVEKVRDEQRDRNVNDQVDQTDKLVKNGVGSEHGQLEEEEHSTLVTSCLQKQPRVPIFRLEIASSSGPMSSPPRTIARKRDEIRDVEKRTKQGRIAEQAAQTDKFVKNGEKLELGQREKEMSSVISACLLKQPKVLIRRLEIVRTSVCAPSSPCPIVKPPNANESLRQKSPDVTQKRKTVSQLERPLELLPSSSVNGICSEGSLISPLIYPSKKNTGQTVKLLSQVFACFQCPFVATEEVNLLRHIGKVHPEELIRDEGSQQPPNSTYQNLSPHKILPSPTLSHTGTPGAHTCSQCGKSFRHLCRLKIHQRTHTGERLFPCSQCGKSFTRADGLKEHQRTHTGERPYHCSQCGKSFTQLSVLKKHQRIHAGERPHICSQCGKSFIWLCQLKLHLRVHTGERPYQCSECGKNFAQASNLKTHQRIHTEEHPYICSQCPFVATEEVNLLQHIGKVHPEELSRAEEFQQPHSSIYMNLTPSETLPIRTQSHTGTSKAHTCSQCGKSFKYLCRLRVHQRTHTGERLYACTQCAKSFTQADGLKQHQQTHTLERPHHCSQCGKSFTQLSVLKKHERIHVGGRPYICSQCGKRFIWSCQLKLHLRVHTGERPYQCSQCEKSFTQLGTLKKHQRIHVGERPYICSQCGKSFIWSCQLKLHLRIHTGERPYKCSQCGKSFTQLGILKKHQRRLHMGERPYICSQCGKSFIWSFQLKQHLQIHTGERPYKCSKCGKSFTQLSVLKKHERIHVGERPFICSQCGKRFTWSCQLKLHLRVHTGERPYQCSQCGKSFTQSGILKKHQRRLHMAERPFICSQCGKGFLWSCQLKQHLQIHTGERPYKCSQCDKSFFQADKLKQHLQIHTGERPYKCSKCGKSFTQWTTLRNHKRTHTGERPYQCSQCGKSFSQLGNMKSHERTHRGEHSYICSQCPFIATEELNLLKHIEKVHPEEICGAEGSQQPLHSTYQNLTPPKTLHTPAQSHRGTPKAHTCSQCGKSFWYLCRLRAHQRTHTGERLYSCSQCGKSFTQACNLKQHLRVHSGERPYQCSQCGKSFSQADQLKQHQRTHTGERPFHCPQCGRSFTQWTTLRNHKRTHTGERPYQCSQCGKSFSQLSNMKTHQRIHSGERPCI